MERKILSNHAPLEIPTFEVSPDFRYILHGGTVKAIGLQKLFLYDQQTGAEHVILETPEYDSVRVEFSPDSKTLALMNISIPHRQALKNEGLFLIDIKTLKQNFFPYPDHAQLPQGHVNGSDLKWGKDGASIYLAFNGRINKLVQETHMREYHRFDIAEKKFHKADGYYEGDMNPSQGYDYVFTDQDRPIPLHENHQPRSRYGHHKLVSPDQKWTAEVKNRRDLVVSENGGNKTTIEHAKLCACGACTMAITAWWDDGALLIYRTDKQGYCIYNPISGEKDVLFEMRDVEAFTWQ